MLPLILDAAGGDYERDILLGAAKRTLELRSDTLVIDARHLLEQEVVDSSKFILYARLLRRLLTRGHRHPYRVLLGGADLANRYRLGAVAGDEVELNTSWHWPLELATLRHRVPVIDVTLASSLVSADSDWDQELFGLAEALVAELPKTPLTRLGLYSYSGYPLPVVVFVGDKLSPTVAEAAWHDWPFTLPTGSSAFLSQALQQAGLSPAVHRFGFVNVNDKGGIKTILKLHELQPGLGFVALGREAQRSLVDLNIKPAMHAHHPQYARRFRYHELRQYGEELLEGYHLALGTERDAAQRP